MIHAFLFFLSSSRNYCCLGWQHYIVQRTQWIEALLPASDLHVIPSRNDIISTWDRWCPEKIHCPVLTSSDKVKYYMYIKTLLRAKWDSLTWVSPIIVLPLKRHLNIIYMSSWSSLLVVRTLFILEHQGFQNWPCSWEVDYQYRCMYRTELLRIDNIYIYIYTGAKIILGLLSMFPNNWYIQISL